MVNITLALPENLHKGMVRHSEIKWSEVARRAFEMKINEIELENTILKKSRLTKKDIDKISHKINKEVFEELNKK